jgi:hypothetical protein
LDDPKLEARSRRISFSSTVSETFVIQKPLTEKLVEAVSEYWKGKGLSIKNLTKPEVDPWSSGSTVELVAEGGTIWTTDFNSYKKSVAVSLSARKDETDVVVRLVLPGGLMSLQDREKAADLIETFYDAMQG